MKDTTIAQLANFFENKSDINSPVSGVSVDSRLVNPNEVFFALPGARVDGHVFLPQAASRGAVGAVVAKTYTGHDYGLPLIRVDNTLTALQSFAKHILARRKSSKVVAVTGSLGKTTTKDFIATLLKKKYRVGFSPGNSNSQIGIPLTILNHSSLDDEVLVLEMGMTEQGQLKNLVNIAPPHIAVLTCVALEHACNFNTLGDIALAKGEIFSHPETKIGILPSQMTNFSQMLNIGTCRKLTFSVASSTADYSLSYLNEHLTVKTPEDQENIGQFTLLGNHNKQNLLAAVSVARILDVSWDEIKAGIHCLKLPDRRLQRIEKDGIIFINDADNANVKSTKGALECLPTCWEGGKRIAIFGEMRELGKFSAQCHREVGEHSLKYVDSMFCYGKECETIYALWKAAKKPIYWTQDYKELMRVLRQAIKPGDVVLLKGARAHKLWRIVDEL